MTVDDLPIEVWLEQHGRAEPEAITVTVGMEFEMMRAAEKGGLSWPEFRALDGATKARIVAYYRASAMIEEAWDRARPLPKLPH